MTTTPSPVTTPVAPPLADAPPAVAPPLVATAAPKAAAPKTRRVRSAPAAKPNEPAAKSKAAKAGKLPLAEAAAPVLAQSVASKPSTQKVLAARPVTASSPQAAKPGKAGKRVAARPLKAEPPKHKAKLVRDSFTIPKDEYAVLAALKQRATTLAVQAKKSEILRAGITVLSDLSDAAFLAALSAVTPLKTGRPRKEGR